MAGLNAAPFILQIALFGAAGAAFVTAHLKNLAARRESGEHGNPARRWRTWRHPHLRLFEQPSTTRLRYDALLQSLWGFGFLIAACLTPFLFRLFHIGP